MRFIEAISAVHSAGQMYTTEIVLSSAMMEARGSGRVAYCDAWAAPEERLDKGFAPLRAWAEEAFFLTGE